MQFSEEEVFLPPSVIAENVRILSEKQSVLQERRICELSEAAEAAASYICEMLSDGMPIADALGLLSLFDSEVESVHREALKESAPVLSLYQKQLSSLDRVSFVSLLLEALSRRKISVSEADFLPPAAAAEVFTYVKNLYADEAYDVFSEAFSDPRLFYSESLRDAVSAVVQGRAGYCLLPLEENGGVRLAGVSQMLYQSNLCIASVTPVYGYGEQTDLTYALVSRGFLIPPVSKEDDRYLELRLPKSSASLSELLFAAEAFGARVYRIHSMRLSGAGDPIDLYSLVFRAEGIDFLGLLTYLFAFVKDFAPVGIYSNLEA
jgi:hypothetical protein